jgi:hypothetical protein
LSAIDIPSSVKVEGNALMFPDNLPWKEYEKIGKSLGAVTDFSYRKLPFMIGDFINYGRVKFPDIYSQACEFTMMDPGTLYNYAFACRRVPAHLRRDSIGIGIACELAKLTDEAEISRWMSEVDLHGYSRTQLRKLMKGEPIGNALPDRVKPWEEIEAEKENPRRMVSFEEWYEANEERLNEIQDQETACRVVWEAARA